MIDAQNLGKLIDGSKKNKELTNDELYKLKDIFDKFQNGEKINIKGLAKSISMQELQDGEFQLSPGRYIEIEDKDKRSDEEIQKDLEKSIEELLNLMNESKEIEKEVMEAIKKIKI